jgi:hypothetical protein
MSDADGDHKGGGLLRDLQLRRAGGVAVRSAVNEVEEYEKGSLIGCLFRFSPGF